MACQPLGKGPVQVNVHATADRGFQGNSSLDPRYTHYFRHSMNGLEASFMMRVTKNTMNILSLLTCLLLNLLLRFC